MIPRLLAAAGALALASAALAQDGLSSADADARRAVRAAQGQRPAAPAPPAAYYYWYTQCESVSFCPSGNDQPVAWHGDEPYVPEASLYEPQPNPKTVCALAPFGDTVLAAPSPSYERAYLDLTRGVSYASAGSIKALDAFFTADKPVCVFRVGAPPARFTCAAGRRVLPSEALTGTLTELLARSPRPATVARALSELENFRDAYAYMKAPILAALAAAKDDATAKAALATLGRTADDEDAGAAIAAQWAADKPPAVRAAALDAHRELVSRHRALAQGQGFRSRLVELYKYPDTHAPDPDRSSPEPANLRMAVRVYPLDVRNQTRRSLGLPPDAQ